MKKVLLVFIAVLFSVAVTTINGSSSVIAQEEAETTSTEMTTMTAENENTGDSTTQSNEAETKDKSAGRDARIKAYKEKVSTKLSDAKSKRVASRCASAQGKITSLRARVQGIVTKRTQSYTKVSEKLDTLIDQLIEAGVDTAPLETAREDVRADLAVLAESMTAYDTVLADLEAMDCEADPQTFATALESAREMQKTLREQAQEFRRFATSELRTAIQEMKTKLEATASAGEAQ